MSLNESITKKYKFLFDAAKDFSPISYQKMGSTTLLPSNIDAYFLKAPVAGEMLDISPTSEIKKETHRGLIVRSVIGYARMADLTQDQHFGKNCLYLSNIINAMLCTAAEYVDLRDAHLRDSIEITFETPWFGYAEPKIIFRELENNAGYELRLYISLEEKNDMDEQ